MTRTVEKGERYCHCVVNRICVWVPSNVSYIFTTPNALVFEGTENLKFGTYFNYFVSDKDLLSYDVRAFLAMLLSEGYSYDICQTFKSCPKETECYDDTVANVLGVM